MAVEIPLGKRGFVALVDDADAESVLQHRWQRFPQPNTSYARGIINGRTVAMHRFIMKPEHGVFIDHIDHNGLNNQRSNLRFATNAQNGANRKAEQKSQTGYIGVQPSQNGRLFRGFIRVNGRTLRTHSYERPDEAALERDKLALLHHGEFAVFNFPGLVKYF